MCPLDDKYAMGLVSGSRLAVSLVWRPLKLVVRGEIFSPEKLTSGLINLFRFGS